MHERYVEPIATELNVATGRVAATMSLLAEGATVPFIARYRKEATGSLDEVAITSIRDRMAQLFDLDKRRRSILESLAERDLLSESLQRELLAASTLTEIEDIYLPYRPKRRTRATMAREKGLEPLADLLLAGQSSAAADPQQAAAAFIDAKRGVMDAEAALAGARDIIAEMVSIDQATREAMRRSFWEHGQLVTRVLKGQEAAGAKFKDYFDWSEPVAAAPSHRVLAMLRGEKEKVLSLRVTLDARRAEALLARRFPSGDSGAAAQVALSVQDGYKRLLAPALATETRQVLKQRADTEAIRVFTENLRELLLTPPLGRKSVLALDPGFRTGCKLVVLDRQGKLLHNETIFPHTGGGGAAAAGPTVTKLCRQFAVEAIAIGNGTAGRETETFVRGLDLPATVPVVMVNESGASIYSASAIAREEFPDHDVTVRGAVSIGRRLLDPLAELVKIDPKSIGVGQYQHDVNQSELKQSLDDVVASCVNAVGVDLNTASRQLLTYVSGLGPQLAANIVLYRDENGAFPSRRALKKVPRLGPKAFEQAAGFLRVSGGKNPLDSSAVHPESYHVVEAMARDAGARIGELVGNEQRCRAIDLERYCSGSIGLPTLRDIIGELIKPGRDPRAQFEVFSFASDIAAIEDLEVGMRLPGIVTNVTNFGAFIDIGVHQDGLAHISQLADRFVRDPGEVVKVQQKVQVTVIDIDLPRRRISLSLKKNEPGRRGP